MRDICDDDDFRRHAGVKLTLRRHRKQDVDSDGSAGRRPIFHDEPRYFQQMPAMIFATIDTFSAPGLKSRHKAATFRRICAAAPRRRPAPCAKMPAEASEFEDKALIIVTAACSKRQIEIADISLAPRYRVTLDKRFLHIDAILLAIAYGGAQRAPIRRTSRFAIIGVSARQSSKASSQPSCRFDAGCHGDTSAAAPAPDSFHIPRHTR